MRGSDRTEKHFLHLVWSLKIEYITAKPRNPRQQICRGEHCSPVLVARQTLRYPHNLLHFTNHVGDGALDVPPPQRFALLFIPQTMTTPQRMVGANSVRPFRSPTQLHEKSKPRNSPETGCRISVSLRTEISPSPYRYSGKSYHHKIAPLGLSLLHWNIILFQISWQCFVNMI